MIEQWREVSGSDGGNKHIETTEDRKNDSRGHSERKEEGEGSSDGEMPPSPSGERFYSHSPSQSQSREPLHSRVKRTKSKTSSDGKLRAKSADRYGRKKDRGPEYQDQPEDADGGECVFGLLLSLSAPTNFIHHLTTSSSIYFTSSIRQY